MAKKLDKKKTTKKTKKTKKKKRAKLQGLSDIRRWFYTSEEPLYFVSATNFNLLGMDDWIPALRHINYIDCYDGRHPRLFRPEESPHAEFTCIEDVNNYLLQHKAVVDYVEKHGPGKAVFLMFDDDTESICKELGLELCFPKASLRREVDNKVIGTRIGNRAGVKSVPNVLGKVEGYESLRKLAKKLGDDLVVQTAFGDSGHTTFFISTEADFNRHKEEILREPEVKVMRRIRCRGGAIEGCVTRHGTIVGPLMTELVGFKELTPYRGGWCGNEVTSEAFTPKIRENARRATFKFGEELRKMGYRGYFELDFLTDLDSGKVYLGEVNPRITGASAMTNNAAFAHADAPLFLFHMIEFSGVDYELDVEDLNQRWSSDACIDTWSQLVMKFTDDRVDRVTKAPTTGIWQLSGDGASFVRAERDRGSVADESEAFFLRITGEGDYRYHGCDLGILLTRGRLMTSEHELTDRARAWIRGIHAAYEGKALEPPRPPDPPQAPFAKMGRFKIL